jgi:GH24 family phage-related lysozyme (muramidase)
MAARLQHMRAVLLSASLILLAACTQQAAPQVQTASADAIAETQDSAAAVVTPAAESVQVTAAEVIVPAVVQLQESVQDAVQAVMPEPTAPAAQPLLVSQAGVDLIVRWEISSPAVYTRKYERPIWPGGASGATIGIGDDLGQQTRYTIGASWVDHPQLERLLPAAGVVGKPARALTSTMRDVRTPFPLAEEVFATSVLPRYHGLTRRTFENGWDGLAPLARDTLVSTVYNRGASMAGSRRAEMRVLRDKCVPAADYACMAAQYRSMCRLWQGTPEGKGLCARYEATARMVETAA